MELACDVCGGSAAGVKSSFIPFSFAYCAACAEAGREPYWACKARLRMSGARVRDGLTHPFFPVQEKIDATLQFLGKSWDDLINEAWA